MRSLNQLPLGAGIAAISLICGNFLIENSLEASANGCKSIVQNGRKFELCVHAKRGTLTDKGSGAAMWFVFDKCVTNSNNYISQVDGEGIGLADYKSIVWNYCNKGWGGFD